MCFYSFCKTPTIKLTRNMKISCCKNLIPQILNLREIRKSKLDIEKEKKGTYLSSHRTLTAKYSSFYSFLLFIHMFSFFHSLLRFFYTFSMFYLNKLDKISGTWGDEQQQEQAKIEDQDRIYKLVVYLY